MKSKGYIKRVLAHILCVCLIVLSVCGTNVSTISATELENGSSIENTIESNQNNEEGKDEEETDNVEDQEDTEEKESQESKEDIDNIEDQEDTEEKESQESKEDVDNVEDQEDTEQEESQENPEAADNVDLLEEENMPVLLAEDVAPIADETTTVYYYNNSSWGTVYAYVYGTTQENVLGAWPGTVVESASDDIGAGWVKINVPAAAPFTIIFNNNSGSQTKDINIDSTDRYIYNDTVYSTLKAAQNAINGIPATTTVYYYNSNGWDSVAGYAYDDDVPIGTTWPGDVATLEGDWYKVVINQYAPDDAFRIIFNNNNTTNPGQQAADVEITKDNSYIVDGNVYESKTAAEEALAAMNTITVYYLNSKDWTNINANAYTDDVNSPVFTGQAQEATDEVGEGWYKISFQHDLSQGSVNVTFSDGTTTTTPAVITQKTGNYVGADGTLYASKVEAEMAAGTTTGTWVYFYNGCRWNTVGAYVYGDKGELLGGFNDTVAQDASELGANWVKVAVPGEPEFKIIFFNKAKDSERAELLIPKGQVYVAPNSKSYATAAEAESAWDNLDTIVYFINNKKWTSVYAYAYTADGNTELLGPKPGVEAVPATAKGEDWYQVTIPGNAGSGGYEVVFSDGTDANKTNPISITKYDDNYTTGNGEIFSTKIEAEKSVGIEHKTVVYYLNNRDWESVSAYVYGECGEVLGSFGTSLTQASTELGGDWLEIEVPANPPFNIIFSKVGDTTDTLRATATISNKTQVYVAGCVAEGTSALYNSAFEAEAAEGLVDESELLVVYFYNSEGWGDINAYAFMDTDGNPFIGTGWPGKKAELAPEIGENWWKASVLFKKSEVSETNAVGIVFNDGINQVEEDCMVTDSSKVYFAVDCIGYATPAEAEAASKNHGYDDGCEEGPNKDLDNYEASLSGPGADLPYVTYEAEAANTNGDVLEKDTTYVEAMQSEASGRQAVKLDAAGEYVEFTLTSPANGLVLRYSIPDSANGSGQDATLSCYINGTEKTDLQLTSKYSWVYGAFPYSNDVSQGKPKRFYDEMRVLFDEVMPAGTKIKVQKDAGDTAAYYLIDFIELEQVGAAGVQPANSLSVTDYGAVANDGQDDRTAFENCITAAQEQNKEVWIPAGTFNLDEEERFEVKKLTIRGAGMWHTNLVGAGVSFHFSGTCKFYDFAMTGVSTVRDDGGDLAGFEGQNRSTNVTIENIWMEHIKVGVWGYNTSNLVVQGCRIRNTFADGINLCSATHNAVVRNNHLRNTGDDCLAIWPWLGDCTNNTFAYNTIQVPTLANGIAIYGGAGNVAEYNHISDTIANGGGICVGTEFETKEPFTGTTTVRYNLLERCGSEQCDEHYEIGAIWVWAAERFRSMEADFYIHDNTLKDCVYAGVLIEGNNIMTGVRLKNITVDGATHAVQELFAEEGSGVASNITATNLSGEFHSDGNPNFILTWLDDNAGNNDNADSSSDSEDSISTDIIPEPKVEIINGQGDVTVSEPYANVVFETKKAILKLELMEKYYRRNLYIVAHLGNGIGYTITNNSLGKAEADLNIGASVEEVIGFATDFDTFHMKPAQKKQLLYEVGIHISIGVEYTGATAYLFSKDITSGIYQLNTVMQVNEIGNVALMTNQMTDVMILIAK